MCDIKTDLEHRPEDEELSKPFYYVCQNLVGSLIVERITLILKQKHRKTLNDFNDFDFQIYTIRATMLKGQTRSRLLDPQSFCLPSSVYKKSDEEIFAYASKRVSQYCLKSSEVKKRHKEILEEAKNNPTILFLIIADEAHWGVTGHRPSTDENGEEQTQAHDTYVNCWNDQDYPNVFVVQVTATPYNLLTEQSRLPLNSYCARKIENGELVAVHHQAEHNERTRRKGRKERLLACIDDKITDVTDTVGPRKQANVIRWTEVYHSLLEKGMYMIIKSLATSSEKTYDKGPIYLVPESGDSKNMTHFIKAMDLDNLQEVIVEGANDRVKIFTKDRTRRLAVTAEHQVGFVKKPENLKNTVIMEFEMAMTFGDDIFALKASFEDSEAYLYYDIESGQVKAHVMKDRVSVNDDVLLNIPPENLFFIYKERGLEEQEHKKRYKSLNFYFNTMWNVDKKEQLIRSDSQFEDLVKKVKRSVPEADTDDILIAEYCIFILAMQIFKAIRMLSPVATNMTTRILQFQHLLEKAAEDIHKVTEQFQQELKPNCINQQIFAEVIKARREQIFEENKEEDLELALSLCILGDRKNIQEHFNKLLQEDALSLEEFASILNNNVFEEIKRDVIERYETGRIVYDLVDNLVEARALAEVEDAQHSKKMLNGKMKVIRASSTKCGDRWHATLILARHIALRENPTYLFEVLRDYGKQSFKNEIYTATAEEHKKPQYRMYWLLQTQKCSYQNNHKECPCIDYDNDPPSIACKNCHHECHKRVDIYEDLDHLPCILILVDKGRMGDTFPRSFNCMDLRLRQMGTKKKTKASPLTTTYQELGRLCRYTDETDNHKLPYALIGQNLEKQLTTEMLNYNGKVLTGNAVSYGSFLIEGEIDMYVMLKRLGVKDIDEGYKIDLKAGKNHYDFDREGPHHENRLLCTAEPQRGKTGSYLSAIAQLNTIICEAKTAETDDEDDDSDAEAEESKIDSNRDDDKDDEQKWIYPYWKFMENSKVTHNITVHSKYAPVFGRWKPGCKPSPMKPLCQFPSRAKLKKDRITNKTASASSKYRCESASHYCCSCKPDVISKQYHVTGPGFSTKISVPNLMRYSQVLHKLGSSDTLSTMQTDLKSWIFMPSRGRVKDACINLYHSMVEHTESKEEEAKSYIQILVVLEEEFVSYCRSWQNVAILQLPDRLMDDSQQTVSAAEGGIGYSRRFIQLFAQHCGLENIFVLDDNVYFLQEATFTHGRVHREDGCIKYVPIPMYKVLKHLEGQIHQNDCSLYSGEPYPATGLREQEKYTGPWCKYGITGILKARRGIGNVTRGFKKTHVHSLVLLNVQTLKANDLLYQPWQVFEDLDMNERCDRKSLWLCKFNRFLLYKKRMPSTIPLVYDWNDIDYAKHTENLATDEENRLYQFISSKAPPQATYYQFDDNGLTVPNKALVDLYNRVNKIRYGRDVHFVCLDMQMADNVDIVEKKLKDHLTGTSGIGGYIYHCIALPGAVCRRLKLKKENFFTIANKVHMQAAIV